MFNLQAILLLTFCTVQIYAIPPDILEIIPPEVLELIYSLRAICSGKHSLTSAEIDSYVITNTDERYKCYMKCMMLEAQWMSHDGTIHYEKILEGSHSDVKPVLERAFEQCRDIPESPEPCGKAYNFNVCLAKADPKHYFLP